TAAARPHANCSDALMSVPAGFDSRDAGDEPPRPLRASLSQTTPVNCWFWTNMHFLGQANTTSHFPGYRCRERDPVSDADPIEDRPLITDARNAFYSAG